MKKTLLIIGLLSYGPSMCAMGAMDLLKKVGSAAGSVISSGATGLVNAFSPAKPTPTSGPMEKDEQDELIAKIENIIKDEGYDGFIDALRMPSNDRYFDISADAPIKGHHKNLGTLIRRDLSDKAIQHKYFVRGGKSMFENEFRLLINANHGGIYAKYLYYDLPTIADAFAQDYLYICINPFDLMVEANQSLAEALTADCDEANPVAVAIRNIYGDALWKRYHWAHDEKVLSEAAAGKALDSDELFRILKERKDSAPAKQLILDTGKQFLSIAVNNETSIKNTLKGEDCTKFHTWLEKVKATGVELQGPKNLDYFITLAQTRFDVLDTWAKAQAILLDCIKKGELTDDGLKALKDHKDTQFLKDFIVAEEASIRTNVIMKELSATSTLESLARLEKWLNGLKEGGIESVSGLTIDTLYLDKVVPRRNDLTKAPAPKNPDNPDKNEPKGNQPGTSRFTLKKVAVGLGLVVASYLVYTKYLQKSDASKNSDTAPAV